ncbi:uncharacterized protein pmfbp1 isoform X3 [Siphateles boraxobius]|uniref:uncharacterized protein pmfbp1 isoform X3 n=1 Tax=Siphateles boraxobius TaxID=180520 RepID=UPI004063D5A0
MMESSRDVVLEQPEESLSDQSTKAKVEEREALILELQDVITELHLEMSLKEQHELQQLQQLLQLETRVKELQEQASTDLTALRGTQLLKTELDVQEQRLWDLQRELQESQQELQRGHDRNQELHGQLQDARKKDQELQAQAERIQWLEEKVSRLKSQHSSVCQKESCGLQRAREELMRKEREEKSFLQEQLNSVREELHSATIREEEHRLKVLQIDELQREVDKTLALLEKEREDCIKAEELKRMREDQLKDKVRHQEDLTAELQRGFDQKEKELKEWKERWYSVSESLQHAHTLIQQTQDRAVSSLQGDVDTLHIALVEEESTVSRLHEVEYQRDLLASRIAELNCDIQHQEKDCKWLIEQQRAEQDEVSSKDEVLRLRGDVRAAPESLTATQDELAEQMQEVPPRIEEVVALQKELSRLQDILKQREEVIENNKHNTTRLQQETDSLYKQCIGQNEELCDLRKEMQYWQQETQKQKESQVKEVQDLKRELQSTQSLLQLHRDNLESLDRQQRDTENEASCREAALHSQDAEMIQLKAGLLEAEKLATDAEARLQPLSESLEFCKQKYQACLSKIAQLENSLLSREEDLKEAHNQVAQREEQVLRLKAQVIALQDDLQVHCTQLESGDDALATLSQNLRDTLEELEHRRNQTHEFELLINTLRDTADSFRRQVEEQEETLVKTQADFSIYRATHIHSDSDYESQLSHVQELEQALFQSLERCGQSAQEMRVCQLELARHREYSQAEMQRLQEQVKKLQADAADEARKRAQADTLEVKVANLEGELQAAQRQCDQAIQKRDALLRQSEADLLQAREKIRSRAAEARGLEADLQRAKKEKRQREKECVSLKTQLLQFREQLKEAHTTCRDTGQELLRQQEKVQMLEGGQHLAQEQLSERVAEVVRAEKAQRRLQAELKRITDSLENTQQELQDSRRLVEHLRAEASSSRSDVLNAQHEAGRLQQEKQQIQDELDISRETLSALQTKLCEQEKLMNTHRDLQLFTHRLQEEGLNCQTQLQLCRRQLETRDDLDQKHHQQMSILQATVSKLKLDLEQVREKWCQGVREAAMADQRGRELRLELSTAQATHKEYMELLAEYSGEVASQRSERARLQRCLIQLTEEKKAQDELVTQMSADLERVHSESRSSEEEAHASEGRLAELMTVLRDREEDVLLLKMETAALREKVSRVEALHSQMDSVDQKYNAAVCEVDVLRQCLGDARSDSSRLHRESQLVVTNVNQWVKEQKHTNEKLALKIKEQSRKIIHLTAERDHLQENVKGLHGEIRRLKAERLK